MLTRMLALMLELVDCSATRCALRSQGVGFAVSVVSRCKLRGIFFICLSDSRGGMAKAKDARKPGHRARLDAGGMAGHRQGMGNGDLWRMERTGGWQLRRGVRALGEWAHRTGKQPRRIRTVHKVSLKGVIG
jgi:hypothetical protein